jgi:murein L,D-transpeptidase YafK
VVIALWATIGLGGPSPAAEPPRVRAARPRAEPLARQLFLAAKAEWPPRALLLRAFKEEGELELWAEPSAGAPYVRVQTWPICQKSGGPGPKRREGDGQVPEGFYRISQLNPWSAFHLSLRVDYPNRADRILGQRPLGGDIFIHGGCVTIGCLPLGDRAIEELYVIATDALKAGARIDVHLFPARFDGRAFAELSRAEARLQPFWEQLRQGHALFERTKRPPRFRVDPDGRYVFLTASEARRDR